jgi:hypothetical protein
MEPADAIAVLEGELEQLRGEKVARHVRAVTARLLAIVRARPKGCLAVVVRDGTEGSDDEDED